VFNAEGIDVRACAAEVNQVLLDVGLESAELDEVGIASQSWER
jgi:hypothetical protein